MDKQQRITELLDRYIKNLCSDKEIEELFIAIASNKYDHIVYDHVMLQLRAPETEGANLEAHTSATIMQNILVGSGQQTTIVRRLSVKYIVSRYIAAAAVILVILTGLALWYANIKNSSSSKVEFNETQKLSGFRVINTTGNAMLVRLPDSSRITLQPAAALYYQKDFNTEKREVYLEGEAFFDIAHNARKPFIVYHEKLMTRVLGTKFFIRYNKQQKEAEVEVTAGRVEVSENVTDNNNYKRNNGVIITPNQKVVYAEDKRLFSTVLVDDPILLLTAISPDAAATPPLYEFEATPMSVIIERLEKDYGIEIQMENEDVKTCLFSGDITNQHLYEKLDILCKAIGISYELKGTRILLKGKGCP